jgi:ornithine carbamoyltransferase
MGQESELQLRLEKFAGFQVNHELMAHAADNAIFMHCLPAHREEEVSGALLEDKAISVVWDEAENRLHAQKALMVFLLSANA